MVLSTALPFWPFGHDPTGTFDLGLVKAFVEAGADRLIVAAFEAEDTSMDGLQRFVSDYLEKIVAKV